jgi:uncharacterized protein
MCIVRFIALLLVVVGALNWGLWGVFQYDLVADLFGGNTTGLARLVYSLVGIAGLYSLTLFFCKGIYKCSHSKKSSCCNEEHKD